MLELQTTPSKQFQIKETPWGTWLVRLSPNHQHIQELNSQGEVLKSYNLGLEPHFLDTKNEHEVLVITLSENKKLHAYILEKAGVQKHDSIALPYPKQPLKPSLVYQHTDSDIIWFDEKRLLLLLN